MSLVFNVKRGDGFAVEFGGLNFTVKVDGVSESKVRLILDGPAEFEFRRSTAWEIAKLMHLMRDQQRKPVGALTSIVAKVLEKDEFRAK